MKLKKPLSIEGKPLAELVFRSHTEARDYLAFDQAGGTAQRQALVASITGLPLAVIQTMHGADYQAAARHCDAMIDADEAAIKAYLKELKEADGSILATAEKRLKAPLQFGKLSVKELRFRDHTVAGDYLAFDLRGGTKKRIALVASIAGVDEAIVEKLHGLDYQIAIAHVDAMIEEDEKSVFADLPQQDAVKK